MIGIVPAGVAIHALGRAAEQIPVDVKWHLTDSVVAKEIHLPAGAMMGKERHNYSHLSYLQSGEIDLVVGGEVRRLKAPAWVDVAAGTYHAVLAVKDSVWVCIHSARETDVPHA